MLTSIEKIDGKDTFVYQFDNNEVASCISYEALKNGDTLFNITEGNKHDTLLMKNNGEIFLNGNLVTFTEEVVETASPESAISEIPGNPIAPCDGSSYNTTNCPYGSPSDYSKLGNTQYTSNVIFGNLIKNLTQASISLVLGKYLSDFNDILSYLSSIVSALGNDDPTSDAASFVRYYYTHATKGYYVSNSGGMYLGVYKVVFSCYSKPNYVGYLRSGIVYQCKTLY